MIEVKQDFSKKYNIEFKAVSEIEFSNYVVIIDELVYKLHKSYLNSLLDNSNFYIKVNATENNKSNDKVFEIIEIFKNKDVNKSTKVLAIGGGIIGDLTGYICSIYMRGLKFIQIPTTLLSQVDSSIGSKVGINYDGIKNFLGSFYEPYKVIIDTSFLKTLTTRVFKEGLVEVIKHSLIKNIEIYNIINSFDNITELRTSNYIDKIIRLSIEVKMFFVQSDYYDKHERHALNYGHTLAHIIESRNDLYHGECVAIGILANLYESNFNLFENIKILFEKFELIKYAEIIDYTLLKYDKKNCEDYIKEVYVYNFGEYKIKEISMNNLQSEFINAINYMKSNVNFSKSCYVIESGELKGNVQIEPSKSFLHRYIICCLYSKSSAVIRNVYSICDDVFTTLTICEKLGLNYTFENYTLRLSYNELNISDLKLNCKDSASSLRMIIPGLSLLCDSVYIDGENQLPKRSISAYENIFKLNYQTENYLPVKLIKHSEIYYFEIDPSLSSQFLSGILMYSLLVEAEIKIKLLSPIVSIDYLNITIDVLSKFNVNVIIEGNFIFTKRKIEIANNYEFDVPQDYSTRSFWELICKYNKEVIIENNTFENSNQPCFKVCQYIKKPSETFDVEQAVDGALIISILMSLVGGKLINTQRLKFKESNRQQVLIELVREIGAEISVSDSLISIKPLKTNDININTYNDHRVLMSVITYCCITKNKVYINEISSYTKSSVNFIDLFTKIGGIIDEI